MASSASGVADRENMYARTTPPPPPDEDDAALRALSHTPAISRIGSTNLHTPQLQHCHVQHVSVDSEHPLEHFTVTFDEDELTLTTVSLLGKGGFGKVYAAHSCSGEWYALKVSSKPMRESDWRRLKEEVALMTHFASHPNIVKLYTAGRDADRAYVVMERCAGRSLHDIVAHHNLSMDEVLWVGWSLVHTVAYIHSKGCIHRDIKPQNLLFDDEGNLKLTDFGLSSRISDAQPRTTVAGTAMYMAPEMAREVHARLTKTGDAQVALSYGKEVDTWSIGVVLYVLLTRTNPYLSAMERVAAEPHNEREHKTLALFHAVANASWEWPTNSKHDSALHALVERMLHPDRARRATLQEVQESSVWNACPRCCPLTLLQKLNLLEHAPLPRACGAVAVTAAARQDAGKTVTTAAAAAAAAQLSSSRPRATSRNEECDNNDDNDENASPCDAAVAADGGSGKRTIAMAVEHNMACLVAAEQRGRTRLALEHQQTLRVVGELAVLLRAEAQQRQALTRRAYAELSALHAATAAAAHTFATHAYTHTAPARRGSSVALVTETATAAVDDVGEGGTRASWQLRRSSARLRRGAMTDGRAVGNSGGSGGSDDAKAATLVRASAERFAVVYPGRDVATRWSLRPVVSLPRDVSAALEHEIRCMNRHVMTKLTAMPHGYNGFDCNVCDRGIVTITADKPAFRCYKCDYDVCMKCAYAGRGRDVNFVCVSCAKRFTTAEKLRAHSLRCRGPSASPSPRRSTRRDTLLWEAQQQQHSPRSLLDVHLPSCQAEEDGKDNNGNADDAAAAAVARRRGAHARSRSRSNSTNSSSDRTRGRSSSSSRNTTRPRRSLRSYDVDTRGVRDDADTQHTRLSARATYQRTSTGTCITLGGNSSVSSVEDVGALVLPHRTADYDRRGATHKHDKDSDGGERDHDAVGSANSDDATKRRPRCAATSSLSSTAAAATITGTPLNSLQLGLPPQVTPPPPSAELRTRHKPQPRSSAELRELLMQVSSMTAASTSTSSNSNKDNSDGRSGSAHTGELSPMTPPLRYNDHGTIIGIAARRRAESVEAALHTGHPAAVVQANNRSTIDAATAATAASTAKTTVVAIRASVADKPLEHARQPRVPRSASATRSSVHHTSARNDSAHSVVRGARGGAMAATTTTTPLPTTTPYNTTSRGVAGKRARDADTADVTAATTVHHDDHRHHMHGGYGANAQDGKPPLPHIPLRSHSAHDARTAAMSTPPQPPTHAQLQSVYAAVHATMRARSVSMMTAQGGPPLPRRGPAATTAAAATPPTSPLAAVHTAVAPSAPQPPPLQQTVPMTRAPPVYYAPPPPPPPAATTTTTAATRTLAPAAHVLPYDDNNSRGGGGAFLALPREQQHRQQFLDDFLSGAWVRLYSFTNEETVVLYYCLQPGRYGAMFPTEAGVGTAVVDIYSKLVLYVPCMNNESTSRSQPHPHVQTFYDEEVRILAFAEAQRYLGGVLTCITHFVKEVASLRSEGLTPAAVHAAYIHHRHTQSVPRETKFVYVRKVFPDPAGAFTLFRLSNLRSHVVCSAMVDIRWQSDRRHNVGQKYYVHADGSAEPFVHDHTGILSQVEMVLNNSYRR